MEQLLIELKKLFAELKEIRSEIDEFKVLLEELRNQFTNAESARYFDNWIPRKKLMEFLEYGDTQIAALFKQGDLVVSEIGIRKFIKKESILKMFEKNLKK
jgi:hypothetical protein